MSLHPALKPLESLIECFQDGILVCDAGAVVVLANDAALRIFGVPRAELMRPVGEFPARFEVRDRDVEAPPPIARSALEGRVVAPVERTLGTGENLRHIQASASPVKDEAGTVVGAVVTIADITGATKRVRTAEATDQAHRAEKELRELFDAMPQLGWEARADGWIHHYNQRWYEYTGTTPQQMEGWGWQSVHDPALLPGVMEKWSASLAAGEPFEMSFTLRRHDGARRWFLTRATPIRDQRGNIARWVGINTDVHEQREAQDRLRALAELAVPLSNARTRAEVADVIVERGMRAAGADTCTLYLLDDTGTSLDLIGQRGAPPEIVERIRQISEHTGNPATFASMRSGTSLWAESAADYEALFPALARHNASGRRAGAFWSMPLVAEGRPIGLLAMGYHDPRRFSSDERAFVDTLAKQCAQALLRAIRTGGEVEAQRALTTHTIRRALLVDAGQALASSLDYRATLATVTRLAVPRLADWCTVELSEPGKPGTQQVALAHADPAKIAFAREMSERYPTDPDARTGVPEVIRSGKPALYPEITAALLEAEAKDAEHLRFLRDLRLESVMIVPLRGRRGTLGAMTFVYADSGRRYTPDDLAFAEEFAARAAMAIETAISFKDLEEARVRESLLRQEAEGANRAKDEFFATVSHELRTPLNAILGWTVILRGKKHPEGLERPLAIIERNARAQARLIEDVLDVSRIVSKKLSLSLGPANIGEAIAGAVEAVTPAANAKGVTLRVDVPDRTLEITADAGRLQQIVWNLTSNAVKFTPTGGTVSVRSYREGSVVFVHVSDTGEGIPKEALPFVFEPFRQADASTTRRHGGLGLGLTIVKQLVLAHGGSVTAESEGYGRGAEFTVQLPARITSIAQVTGHRASSAPPSLVDARRAPPRLDGLKLLVVDDEEDSRALVGEVLGALGAEVHVAGSVDEALLLFERVRPDVLVSDIGMPIVDGYALIKRVRALPPELGGQTPAVAVTAFARKEDAERAFAAGYQSHVAKPVEPAHLATIVANLGGRILE